ncbi:MAG: hypothetical protein JST70_10855 [Bacteroidetes bacterium]|nr:hypothetical protein [Bacteroidota bacterium]
MLFQFIAMGVLFAFCLAVYYTGRAIFNNWRDIRGALMLLFTAALGTTTFLIYVDESPGFKNKMATVTDWIMAAVYFFVFFTFFSGLFFLLRKKTS